jgi:predicted kinase
MKTVTLLKGLPASGKTHWAKEQMDKHPGRYKRISKDDLRAMLDNGKWTGANEKFILKTRDALILLALETGYHVLVDDSNLHPKHEIRIRELVKGIATVEIQDFTDVPLETCIERDQKRPHYVGEQVIRKMCREFLQPAPVSPVYDPSLPDALICDLDGTLALLNGRNPYDASLCEEDGVNVVVHDILKRYQATTALILVSGRSTQHREQTLRWLEKHDIHYDVLLMRAEGDYRKDAIIKQEMYEHQIKGKCNIQFVLDDRDQVVGLWRGLGLVTLQVADGDF